MRRRPKTTHATIRGRNRDLAHIGEQELHDASFDILIIMDALRRQFDDDRTVVTVNPPLCIRPGAEGEDASTSWARENVHETIFAAPIRGRAGAITISVTISIADLDIRPLFFEG